jgi:TIR domain-containing protein
MRRVFLSHSRRDADLAAGIARELRKRLIEPFDAFESVTDGEDWRQTIKSAIRRADGFVLIVSAPESASTSWASYELGIAEALGKRILLLLSHNHTAAQLPVDMAGLPIVPFDPGHPELAAHEVVDSLLAAA